MLTQQQRKAFLEAVAAAKEAEKQTGSPAALAVAQWWIESHMGDAIWGNNCFGIKAYPGCYGKQLLRTHERFTDRQVIDFLKLGEGRTCTLEPLDQTYDHERKRLYAVRDFFATFPTLEAAFVFHGHLLTLGLYAEAWRSYQSDRNLDAYVRGIAPHYATAENYAEALLERIHSPEVALP